MSTRWLNTPLARFQNTQQTEKFLDGLTNGLPHKQQNQRTKIRSIPPSIPTQPVLGDAHRRQQHTGHLPALGIGPLGRRHVGEPALELVELRADVLAEAEEPTGIDADDGQQQLRGLRDRFAGQRHDLAPVEGFRRRFAHIQGFAWLGHLHPGLQHDDRSCDLVADANQPGGIRKTVLGPPILENVHDELDYARGRIPIH